MSELRHAKLGHLYYLCHHQFPFIVKKLDRQLRITIIYKDVIKIVVADYQALLIISKLLTYVRGTPIYTKMELKNG
jgi:hypothetical protein